MSVPTRTVYVGNISFSATSESLMESFADYDPISVKVIDGKGVAFVEVPAKRAFGIVKDLDGSKLDGRLISVSIATPRQNEPTFTQDQDQERKRRDEERRQGGFNDRGYDRNPRFANRENFQRPAPRGDGDRFQNRGERPPSREGEWQDRRPNRDRPEGQGFQRGPDRYPRRDDNRDRPQGPGGFQRGADRYPRRDDNRDRPQGPGGFQRGPDRYPRRDDNRDRPQGPGGFQRGPDRYPRRDDNRDRPQGPGQNQDRRPGRDDRPSYPREGGRSDFDRSSGFKRPGYRSDGPGRPRFGQDRPPYQGDRPRDGEENRGPGGQNGGERPSRPRSDFNKGPNRPAGGRPPQPGPKPKKFFKKR